MCVSCISKHRLHNFCYKLSFQGCLYEEQRQKTQCFLLHIIDDLGALSSGFLSHNPLHAQVSPGPCLSPSRNWGSENESKYWYSGTALCSGSFVSGFGSLKSPANIHKIAAGDLLACKEDKKNLKLFMIFDTTYLVGLQSRFLKNDTLLDTLTCNTFSEYIGTKCFLIFFLFYYETLMTSFKLLCISVDLLLLSECYINLIKNDDGEDSFSSFSGKTPLPSFFLGK